MFSLTIRRVARNSVAILFLISVLTQTKLLAQGTQAVTPSPAQASSASSSGQRIGTIIKDAISTAFPGVSGIGGVIDAIWKAKPTTGSKVDQPQLATAVTNSQDTIKKSVVAQAQQNLTGLSNIANELQVVSQFGVPTTTAGGDIIRISERLQSEKAPTEDEWTAIKEDWKEAAGELATVKNADVSKVEDKWLRDKLSSIQQTNITYVARIDTELAAKNPNVNRLKELLDKLSATIQDISAAVGYEVTDMQAELKSLSDWAKGAAGPNDNTISAEGKLYINYLNKNVQ